MHIINVFDFIKKVRIYKGLNFVLCKFLLDTLYVQVQFLRTQSTTCTVYYIIYYILSASTEKDRQKPKGESSEKFAAPEGRQWERTRAGKRRLCTKMTAIDMRSALVHDRSKSFKNEKLGICLLYFYACTSYLAKRNVLREAQCGLNVMCPAGTNVKYHTNSRTQTHTHTHKYDLYMIYAVVSR